MNPLTRSTYCRCCGCANLQELVDFGRQPLAGNFPLFPESTEACKRYPLDLSICRDCGLLQVTHLPPIDEVFHADYRYASSTVPGLVRHFTAYADWLRSRLPECSRVLEFGCNDGVLLKQLAQLGHDCVGVDASENVAALARSHGLDVRTGFFTPSFVEAQQLTAAFDLVTCSNVFAHIHEVRDCARAARNTLKAGGQFCVEVHNGAAIFDENQFDTVYHEHLSYYTDRTLSDLLVREGFEVEEVVRTAMHGDGLRVRARRSERTDARRAPASATDLSEIDSAGRRVNDAIARSAAAVRRLHEQHGALQAYGAAGRSQMFLNFTGTAGCFNVIYDDSTLRQGRYIAGTDLQIRPYDGQSGHCCVILAWNYAADISARLRGRFDQVVTLLPEERHW